MASSKVVCQDGIRDTDLEKHRGSNCSCEIEADRTLDSWGVVSAIAFEGPDDPTNPTNWAKGRKWTVVGLLSAMTLVVYEANTLP